MGSTTFRLPGDSHDPSGSEGEDLSGLRVYRRSRLYVMGQGRIVFEGRPEDLTANAAIRKEWLEV